MRDEQKQAVFDTLIDILVDFIFAAILGTIIFTSVLLGSKIYELIQ